MVFVVQVNIEDPVLLKNYAKIINATTSTKDTKHADLGNAVIDMEKKLAETLFKGMKEEELRLSF